MTLEYKTPSKPDSHISIWSSEEMAYRFLNKRKIVDSVAPKIYLTFSLSKNKNPPVNPLSIKRTRDRPA